MAHLIDIPVEAGGRLLVEAVAVDRHSHLERAGGPTELIARAGQSLERAIDDVKPALGVVLDRLRTLAASEVEVDFGLVLGAETGIIVAKADSEIHLAVKLTWKRSP